MVIGWEDIYKVLLAITPLYVALVLGYVSMRWLHIFTPEQCNAINPFVCYFTVPFFIFDFTAHVDPFKMNYLFIGADAISKFIIVIIVAIWTKCSRKGSYCWSITSFSICTLTNSLVVGVPLIKAMYGPTAVDFIAQGSVIQAILWLPILLFALESCKARSDVSLSTKVTNPSVAMEANETVVVITRPPFWSLMKIVWLKLALNPNSYACIIGIMWAFISHRWHFKMPKILEESLLIMSNAGTGTSMFSLGLFMALQQKLIACSTSLTLFGMVLRFVAGPAAMAISAIALGMHGDVLRVAIIQVTHQSTPYNNVLENMAALPLSITSFIYAKEYGLHADVLSTAIIFGMMVSLPVLIAYYAVLEFLC